MERQMLAAAIVAAADHLRALHSPTHGDMQKAWRHAAAGFRQATPAQVPLWNAHECQAAITSCLMAFDLIIGTTMTGIGMTQRAATLIQEWAIVRHLCRSLGIDEGRRLINPHKGITSV